MCDARTPSCARDVAAKYAAVVAASHAVAEACAVTVQVYLYWPDGYSGFAAAERAAAADCAVAAGHAVAAAVVGVAVLAVAVFALLVVLLLLLLLLLLLSRARAIAAITPRRCASPAK